MDCSTAPLHHTDTPKMLRNHIFTFMGIMPVCFYSKVWGNIKALLLQLQLCTNVCCSSVPTYVCCSSIPMYAAALYPRVLQLCTHVCCSSEPMYVAAMNPPLLELCTHVCCCYEPMCTAALNPCMLQLCTHVCYTAFMILQSSRHYLTLRPMAGLTYCMNIQTLLHSFTRMSSCSVCMSFVRLGHHDG